VLHVAAIGDEELARIETWRSTHVVPA
jgi:hypothetical protein